MQMLPEIIEAVLTLSLSHPFITIYQVKDGTPVPLLISTGITDGNFTEITGGDIKAGDSLIVRDASDDNKPERKLRFRMF